ncbi:hypothetical protein [Halioxenophilus sp. WMMB6]|uniref:hypothetical protein n=1 Tax=Halioxenophilus sp. WMMB6 TaxID=3073815 RepID=UPI00295EE5DF|nr:hypothetical protein [Halioxenophilus sp. WMMB6]
MNKNLCLFYVAALFFTPSITGCAGKLEHELTTSYKPETESQLGIVIGSVSARPAPGNPPWYEWSQYQYRSLSSREITGSISSAFKWNPFYMWGTMPLCADDGLEHECGHLFALALPAGVYEIHQVTPAMMSRTSDHSFSPSGWSLPLTQYTFVVQTGQALYIGNLLSRICIGGIKRGNQVMAAIGLASDQAERDLPLLIAKYPQLNGLPIIQRPLADTPWQWRFKESDGFQPPYGWPSDCALEPGQVENYLNDREP